ncbi:hypothetical protein [uncultured Microbacterium sp.]|uniref:hypothetical protein n=1 Tax=uncultured Microbacterium sp. TaxID=191216 RepID=UPI0028D525D1|nr:hypothetical protein [uncultured Microbacterium sp.]
MIGEAAWRILVYLFANAVNVKIDGEVGVAGEFAVSDATLAAEIGAAPRTVRDATHRLELLGAIKAQRVVGRRTVYTVCPRWVPPVDQGVGPMQPTAEVDRAEPTQPTGEVANTPPARPMQPTAEVDTKARQSTGEVGLSPIGATRSSRARSDHEDVKTSPVRGTPQDESISALVVGGAGVEPPNVADSVAGKALGAHAPDTTQEPLHPTARANWDHEGKPTEAHWRALEALTWRTYGVEIDRSALDWYDMNAWRTRMGALAQEQVS